MGSVAYNPTAGKDYKWYISGIFSANWGMDYATDPTFKGNQKQPLMFFYFFWRGVTNDGHTFFLVEKRRLNCWKLLRSNSKRRKFDQK